MSSTHAKKAKRRARASAAKQRQALASVEPRLRGKDLVRPSARLRITGRLVLTTILSITSIMGLIGLGASSTFNDTKSQTQTISAGTVVLSLGSTGSVANRLNIAATGIAPGDSIQRSIDVINSGSIDWASLKLSTVATTSSLLDTDATNGLQMVVDECSVGWTEVSAGAGYTYTCSDTTTIRIASRAVIGANLSVGGAALTHGTTGHYRVTLTLPTTADNTFQGLSSSIEYTFVSSQRTGIAK